VDELGPEDCISVVRAAGVRRGETNPMQCLSKSDQSPCSWFGEKSDVGLVQFPHEGSTPRETISRVEGRRVQLADYVESEGLLEYAREHVGVDVSAGRSPLCCRAR
jgi:hypothetical protein